MHLGLRRYVMHSVLVLAQAYSLVLVSVCPSECAAVVKNQITWCRVFTLVKVDLETVFFPHSQHLSERNQPVEAEACPG